MSHISMNLNCIDVSELLCQHAYFRYLLFVDDNTHQILYKNWITNDQAMIIFMLSPLRPQGFCDIINVIC